MVIQRRLRITIRSALNRAFKDWGAIFRDMVCAKAIIDRLVHHSLCAATHKECYVVSPVMCCPSHSFDDRIFAGHHIIWTITGTEGRS